KTAIESVCSRLSIRRVHQRFQAFELCSLMRSLVVPSCLGQCLGKREVGVGAARSKLNRRSQLVESTIIFSDGQPQPAACYMRRKVPRRQRDRLAGIFQALSVFGGAQEFQSELDPRRVV